MIRNRLKGRYMSHEREQLVDRVVLLRAALHGVTTDNANVRRELARLRKENRQLRAELDRRDTAPGKEAILS